MYLTMTHQLSFLYAFNLGKKMGTTENTYRFLNSSNNIKQYLYSVHNWISIVQGSTKLQGPNIQNQPFAVYRNKKGQVWNIPANRVITLIKSLAVEAYKLTKKEDTQLFPVIH